MLVANPHDIEVLTCWNLTRIFFLPPAVLCLICWVLTFFYHPFMLSAILLSLLSLWNGYFAIIKGQVPWDLK